MSADSSITNGELDANINLEKINLTNNNNNNNNNHNSINNNINENQNSSLIKGDDLIIKNSLEPNFILYEKDNIVYKTYSGETLINEIMDIMKEELSEPYPIFTYRFFLNGWPALNVMVFDREKNNKFIGCIIGKCERNKKGKMKGYIAMIAVDKDYRGKKIGRNIVEIFISQCKKMFSADEIELETEVTNAAALNLYGCLGFIRTKILYNYYLNNNNAYKLKLWFSDYNSSMQDN